MLPTLIHHSESHPRAFSNPTGANLSTLFEQVSNLCCSKSHSLGLVEVLEVEVYEGAALALAVPIVRRDQRSRA